MLQVSGGRRCDTQYWSGLVCVASAIRAVADRLQLGLEHACCRLARSACLDYCYLAYRKTLARFFTAASVTTQSRGHSQVVPSHESFHLQGLPVVQLQQAQRTANLASSQQKTPESKSTATAREQNHRETRCAGSTLS